MASFLDMIHGSRPQAKDIVDLVGGNVNRVFLVNRSEVFRFPKAEKGRKGLRYEVEILKLLTGKLFVDIPITIEVAADYSYGVFSYVAGEVLSPETINNFPDEDKVELGHSLAHFIEELNTVLSFQDITHLRKDLLPDFATETVYHEQMHELGKTTNNPLYPKYSKLFDELCERYGGGFPEQNMLAHDDLHNGNLIFGEDNSLRGIIDFSHCGPSTIYSELRQMYDLGDKVIEAIVEDLGDRYGKVDLETIRLHAITHEFSVMMRPGAMTGENTRALVSQILLKNWLGDNWREL